MGLRKKKSLIDQASDYVETVRPAVEAAVGTAVVAAMDAAKEAKDRAIPLLADARDKAGPALADARDRRPGDRRRPDKAAPILAAGARSRREGLAGASLAAEKAARAVTWPLPGSPSSRASRRRREGRKLKALLYGGSAAAAAFVAKKLQGGKADNWQSSYVPTPAPRPPATPPTPPARWPGRRDAAGASPTRRSPTRRRQPPRHDAGRAGRGVSIDDRPRASATNCQQPVSSQYDVNGAGRRRDPRPVLSYPGVDPLPPAEQPVDPVLAARRGSPRAAPATTA
jgi:hypothetical protein